jgi:hypothetical protein
MRKFAIIALVAALAVLSGCENQQNKLEEQHHQFALGNCVAETNKADAALKEMSIDSGLDQRGHDYRAAQCMSVEEKTTIAFQQAKHDDYGKCEQCGVSR